MSSHRPPCSAAASSELRALFASVQHDLVRSDAGSVERSQALSSLDTISRVIARKMSLGLRP